MNLPQFVAKTLLAWALFLACANATAQITPPSSPPIPEQGLRGFVTDEGGSGIYPVFINLSVETGPAGSVMANNTEGEYLLWLSPGDYNVTVEASGYLRAEDNVTIHPKTWVTRNFTLRPTATPPPFGGDGMTPPTSSPVPEQGLQGFVRNAGGQGIHPAFVNVSQRGAPGTAILTQSLEGGFMVWLSPGTYDVAVEAPGYLQDNTTVTIHPRSWVSHDVTLLAAQPESGGEPVPRASGYPLWVAGLGAALAALAIRCRR